MNIQAAVPPSPKEPARLLVDLPWPWRERWHTLYALDPDSLDGDDPRWVWMSDHAYLADHPSGFTLYVDWVPDGAPDGHYRLLLEQQQQALAQLQTRSLAQMHTTLLQWTGAHAQPVPTDAEQLLDAIADQTPARILPALTRWVAPSLLLAAANICRTPELTVALLAAAIRGGDVAAWELACDWLNQGEDERALLGLAVLREVDTQAVGKVLLQRLEHAWELNHSTHIRRAVCEALAGLSHPPPFPEPRERSGPALPGSPRLVRAVLKLPLTDPAGAELEPYPLTHLDAYLQGDRQRAVQWMTRLAAHGDLRARASLSELAAF